VLSVSATVAEAIPNYYGLQRFGVARPITHQVGEKILKGDHEAALAIYVGLAYPGESEHVRAARSAFFESRNAREALDSLPLPMSYERSMLHHLVSHPGDYEGALLVLPPKLLSLLVSAFQSYLFNCVLSTRFEENMTLSEPGIGDRLIFANGREDIVTERNRPVAIQHLARKRCRIAIFVPGSEPVTIHGPMDAAMQRLMEERGIDAEAFRRASAFVKTKFAGALRPISLSASVNSSIEERNVRLQFTLPPGHYATTVCREYMKADPLQMV